MATEPKLLERKARLDKRLKDRGITNYEIRYLPYLDFDEAEFASTKEVAARMIILYLSAYSANNDDSNHKIVGWLKQERLWSHVSPEEKKLFEGRTKDSEKLEGFSWCLESAYTLAWVLNLVSTLHPPISELSAEQIVDFQRKMPRLGTDLGSYFTKLDLRNKEEVFEENIFNELVTTYFRDLLFNGKTDTTDIDSYVSFERHKVLNWVRRFSDIVDWDDTDTST
ncbi:DUF4272 domain-containing protein [uncultured Imperialibacter sp.]|uniref:DUF4272 domain-containing protein n=1 Tax=uncultured Imperialibacter sp. TaxID=1672639 RepID=UPI0030D79875|tara:strand:- start:17447 stop:18121 length:675 start_codon:yes stop_codon:yes gene_type:complete